MNIQLLIKISPYFSFLFQPTLKTKAQGQTAPRLGIYLPEPVFGHGQLYVALSRSTGFNNVRIFSEGNNARQRKVCNIVYREVLENL